MNLSSFPGFQMLSQPLSRPLWHAPWEKRFIGTTRLAVETGLRWPARLATTKPVPTPTRFESRRGLLKFQGNKRSMVRLESSAGLSASRRQILLRSLWMSRASQVHRKRLRSRVTGTSQTRTRPPQSIQTRSTTSGTAEPTTRSTVAISPEPHFPVSPMMAELGSC